MKKIILTSLISLFMVSGCSQIKGVFDPNKIVQYSNEISLGTKYVVKFALKNQDLTVEQLGQVKHFLVVAQSVIDLEHQVDFSDLNQRMVTNIQDPKIQSLVAFVLTNVEKYVNSYNLNLSERDINVIKITQAALSGAIDAVDELLET